MNPLALNIWRWRATLSPAQREAFEAFVAWRAAARRDHSDGGYVLTSVEHAARLPAQQARALRAIVAAASAFPNPPNRTMPAPYLNLSVARTETVDKDETITIHAARRQSISLNECLHMLARLPDVLRTEFAT